jgi:hypothetical protein
MVCLRARLRECSPLSSFGSFRATLRKHAAAHASSATLSRKFARGNIVRKNLFEKLPNRHRVGTVYILLGDRRSSERAPRWPSSVGPCLLLSLLPVAAYILIGPRWPAAPTTEVACGSEKRGAGRWTIRRVPRRRAAGPAERGLLLPAPDHWHPNGTHKLRATRARTVQIDAGC